MKANHNEELATSLIPEAVSNGSKILKRSRVRTKYTKNAKNIGIKKRASSHEPLAPVRKALKAFLLNCVNVT